MSLCGKFCHIHIFLRTGLKTDPPEGIEAIPLDQKNCHWMATITGPVGSPYEGGVFYLYLQVPYRLASGLLFELSDKNTLHLFYIHC